MTAPYSDAGTGYTSVSNSCGTTTKYYPTDMQIIGDGAAIFPLSVQSDMSKGWTDYFYRNNTAGYVTYTGGDYSDAVRTTGPFALNFAYSTTTTNQYIGSRIIAA